jgi:hypothetical protein
LIDALDESIGHAKTIHPVSSRSALGDHGDEMQCGLHWRRRIRLLPTLYFSIETIEHVVDGILAEHAHMLRERIAVERDDPATR